ncbi:MAG: helix-turn-helix transcriptional regulator [Pirellulaceae bacterium]|nr:helix-turn-helix transcriptional regulator [Pirellulaceae bacterium]
MISDQLKVAIRSSGLSLNQLAKNSGISRPVLSRFVESNPDSHRDIRLEATADKLAAYFGLELQPEKKQARKK